MDTYTASFERELRDFLSKTKMSPTAFGVSIGYRQFAHNLRAGRNVTVRTIEKARLFMETYQDLHGNL